jgi:hypothetical protein
MYMYCTCIVLVHAALVQEQGPLYPLRSARSQVLHAQDHSELIEAIAR